MPAFRKKRERVDRDPGCEETPGCEEAVRSGVLDFESPRTHTRVYYYHFARVPM